MRRLRGNWLGPLLAVSTMAVARGTAAQERLPLQVATAQSDIREAVTRAWIERESRLGTVRVSFRFPGSSPEEFVHSEMTMTAHCLRLDTGHGSPSQPWQRFYARTDTWCDGKVLCVGWPVKRVLESRPIEAMAEIERIAVQVWFRASGVWPLASGRSQRAPEFFGASIRIADLLQSAAYAVQAAPEDRVIVTNDGYDTIELGEAPDYPLVARTWYRGGLPAMKLTVVDWWTVPAVGRLPRRFEVTPILDGHGREYEGRHRETFAVDVLSCEVLATIENPPAPVVGPGWLRLTRDAGSSAQAVPGGVDLLVSEGDALEAAFRRRREEHRSRGDAGMGALLLLAIAAAGTFLWLAIGSLVRRRAP